MRSSRPNLLIEKVGNEYNDKEGLGVVAAATSVARLQGSRVDVDVRKSKHLHWLQEIWDGIKINNMARIKEGAFFEIALPNSKYSYGRILGKASYAFYNIYSESRIIDINLIRNSKVIFIVAVYNHAITKNRWKTIGITELEEDIKRLPLKFIQDDSELSQFEIYDPNTGDMRPAKKLECIGLERAAVWEPEHVEDRIIDYFEGRPNKWFESLKIKE